MIAVLFFTAIVAIATAIYITGAWTEESSRLHDIVAFTLLCVVMALYAIILDNKVQPFEPPCLTGNCVEIVVI